MFFKSKNNKTEIFISLGDGCPTGCQGCLQTIKKVKSKDFKNIKNIIDNSLKFCDENFSFFLYGTNNLQNKNLEKIQKYIISLGKKYRTQIPINSSFSDLEKIYISPNNEFVISKKIKTKEDFKSFLINFKEFYGKNNFIINYDLLLNKDFILILEKFLKINFKKNKDLTYSLNIKNIFINIRKLYNIDFQKQKVKDLKIKKCFSLESFKIEKNFIVINDHLEIDEDLNLNFHNPLCYLGNNKISNLKRTKEEILKDFKNYQKYLEKFNNNFEKNCFVCIKQGFSYEKVL